MARPKRCGLAKAPNGSFHALMLFAILIHIEQKLSRISLRMAEGAGDKSDLDLFFQKAAELLAEAGGQMDSLTFGRKWRSKYPLDDLEKYKRMRGNTLGSLLASSPKFQVWNRRNTAMKTFALAKGLQDTEKSDNRDEGSKGGSEGGSNDAATAPSSSASPSRNQEQSPPRSQKLEDVEERTSPRGYSFAVVNTNSGLNDSQRKPPTPGVPQPPPASKLMDIWSQAAAHADAGAGEEAEQGALELLREAGASPEAMPYTRLINEQARAAAAGDRHALDRAFKVLAEMEAEGISANRITYTALITACARSAGAGLGVSAVISGEEALAEMLRKGVAPDVVTYNALLDACAKATTSASAEGLERGLALLEGMQAAGVPPNRITFNTLMHACARAATEERPWAMEQGMGLLQRMQRSGVDPDVMTYNALVDACARSGQGGKGVTAALEIFREMTERDLQPDVVTYNSLINACARAAGARDASAFRRALEVLGRMERSGVSPSVVTFNSLMTIIARAASAGDIPDCGAAVSQGKQVISMMLNAGLRPNVITFNALLTAAMRASGEAEEEELLGDLGEALRLMAQMQVRANSVTFQTIVDGLPLQGGGGGGGSVRLLRVLQLFKEVGLEVDAGIYTSVLGLAIRGGDATVGELLPLLELMEQAGALPSTATFNAILALAANPNTGEDGVVEAVKVLELMRRNRVPLNSGSTAAVHAVRDRVENESGLMNNFYAKKYYKSEEELLDDEEIADWITIIDGEAEREREGRDL